MTFSRREAKLINVHCSSQKAFWLCNFLVWSSIFDNKASTYDDFSLSKKYINDGLSSLQIVFGPPTSSYEVEFAMAIIKYLWRSFAIENKC